MNEDNGRTLLEIVRRYNNSFMPAMADHQPDVVHEARQAVELLIRESSDDPRLVDTARDVLRFMLAEKPVPEP